MLNINIACARLRAEKGNVLEFLAGSKNDSNVSNVVAVPVWSSLD